MTEGFYQYRRDRVAGDANAYFTGSRSETGRNVLRCLKYDGKCSRPECFYETESNFWDFLDKVF